MQSAVKVGGLVVVFAALLFGAYAVLGERLFGEAPARYPARFANAGGIPAGTRVLLAGVRVGQVERIDLADPRTAVLTLALDPEVRLPRGTIAVVPSSLVGIGDQPLELRPPATTAGYLSPGEMIEGRLGSPLDNILSADGAKDTLTELTATLRATRRLLEDRRLPDRVATLLETTNQTAERFGNLAAQLDGALAENRAPAREALESARLIAADVRRTTNQLAILLERGELQRDAKALTARLVRIAESTDGLVKSLDGLVNDPRLRDPAAGIAKNVETITQTGTRIAANTEKITADGTIISRNTIDLTEKAKTVADKAIEIETKISKGLDKVESALERLPKARPITIESSLDILRQSEPGYTRTDANFRTGSGEGTLHFGVFDAFESNRLNLQFGQALDPRTQFRYGIFASKAAVGLDYALTPRFGVRLDAFNVNEPQLDLRARVEFGNGVYGWFGMERVFRDNAAVFGIGVRR